MLLEPVVDEVGADEPGRSGDEDPHGGIVRVTPRRPGRPRVPCPFRGLSRRVSPRPGSLAGSPEAVVIVRGAGPLRRTGRAGPAPRRGRTPRTPRRACRCPQARPTPAARVARRSRGRRLEGTRWPGRSGWCRWWGAGAAVEVVEAALEGVVAVAAGRLSSHPSSGPPGADRLLR